MHLIVLEVRISTGDKMKENEMGWSCSTYGDKRNGNGFVVGKRNRNISLESTRVSVRLVKEDGWKRSGLTLSPLTWKIW